jgi:hypothetical protein|tara:strand:+ start:347 stop:562 length:216 start_codon:yes stop_codon:yes gene_type:complete
MKDINTDIDFLKTQDAFLRFMGFVQTLKDECISDLHDASTDKIQQISGRILSYDQLLEITEYSDMKHLLQD